MCILPSWYVHKLNDKVVIPFFSLGRMSTTQQSQIWNAFPKGGLLNNDFFILFSSHDGGSRGTQQSNNTRLDAGLLKMTEWAIYEVRNMYVVLLGPR